MKFRLNLVYENGKELQAIQDKKIYHTLQGLGEATGDISIHTRESPAHRWERLYPQQMRAVFSGDWIINPMNYQTLTNISIEPSNSTITQSWSRQPSTPTGITGEALRELDRQEGIRVRETLAINEQQRREAQREAERRRLDEEQSRPSFLRSINPFT